MFCVVTNDLKVPVLQGCVQELPKFINSQVTFPEVCSKRCVQRGVLNTPLEMLRSDLELSPKLWLEPTPQISERVPFLFHPTPDVI